MEKWAFTKRKPLKAQGSRLKKWQVCLYSEAIKNRSESVIFRTYVHKRGDSVFRSGFQKKALKHKGKREKKKAHTFLSLLPLLLLKQTAGNGFPRNTRTDSSK